MKIKISPRCRHLLRQTDLCQFLSRQCPDTRSGRVLSCSPPHDALPEFSQCHASRRWWWQMSFLSHPSLTQTSPHEGKPLGRSLELSPLPIPTTIRHHSVMPQDIYFMKDVHSRLYTCGNLDDALIMLMHQDHTMDKYHMSRPDPCLSLALIHHQTE